jgi:uncharacterized protein
LSHIVKNDSLICLNDNLSGMQISDFTTNPMYKCHNKLTRRLVITWAFWAMSLIPLSACLANGPKPEFKQRELQINQQIITVEVADNERTRQYGLMFRNYLPFNQGMWFEFNYPGVYCMWMKNTYIDLDVAFVDEYWKIINIENMKANTSSAHCSKGDARYALEMNSGWFLQNNIANGDTIKSTTKKADQ